MKGVDWLNEIRALPEEQLFVAHEPPTPRYGRALAKLGYIVRESVVVGTRPADYPGATEVALWARAPDGDGYYSCVRIFSDGERSTAAVLFCFYDGTEGSPRLRSMDTARAYASSHGFELTSQGDEHD